MVFRPDHNRTQSPLVLMWRKSVTVCCFYSVHTELNDICLVGSMCVCRSAHPSQNIRLCTANIWTYKRQFLHPCMLKRYVRLPIFIQIINVPILDFHVKCQRLKSSTYVIISQQRQIANVNKYIDSYGFSISLFTFDVRPFQRTWSRSFPFRLRIFRKWWQIGKHCYCQFIRSRMWFYDAHIYHIYIWPWFRQCQTFWQWMTRQWWQRKHYFFPKYYVTCRFSNSILRVDDSKDKFGRGNVALPDILALLLLRSYEVKRRNPSRQYVCVCVRPYVLHEMYDYVPHTNDLT